ncbi:SMP-30/gluconolactonase/LRE family protein [Salinisphaera sp.]|uniref:SMP-30/gluconolactonase/LRE family protein n=1 Tax=Salinisphaera sp. TaxID=1914330 RepID=UPI000C4BFF55|nr:SMP-30/gluconolactonase/LRE family protein [Salinisphaera sp.]MBS61427.1 gluconolactonase [Salinisphaera sp.]
MKNLFTLILIALVAFVGYALFWPSDFMPQPWTVAPATTGAAPVRSAPLAQAERLGEGTAVGPEDVAVDNQGRLYAGYEDGTIRRFDPDGGNGEVFATTNGRPLGLAFSDKPVAPADDEPKKEPTATTAQAQPAEQQPPQTLVVADADKGLLAINPAGDITILASGAEGRPFKFTDDVDVGRDGTIYFTDASSKYDRHAYRSDILEHGGHGRLMEYDPATGTVTVLLGGLQFANGVAVSADDAYVLVTETGSYRVLRYWLSGDKAGQSDIFIDRLPGFPDGVSHGLDSDTFWVALFAPRNRLLDFTADKPWLRRIIFHLPRALQPEPAHIAGVMGIKPNGTVVTDLRDDREGAFAPITSVEEQGNTLYLGSLSADAFARMPRPTPETTP